jgi:hypothetical protein
LLTGKFGVGWLDNKSRMMREYHVRFREQLKGEVPFGRIDHLAERFFRSLKHEQLNYEKFKTQEAAKLSIIDYLAFYNGKRTHSKLGYQSPSEFEREFYGKVS